MVKAIGLTALLLTMAGVAAAGQPCKSSHRDRDCRPVPVKAPEIDSTAAIAGFTLFFGGLAVLRSRRVKNTET